MASGWGEADDGEAAKGGGEIRMNLEISNMNHFKLISKKDQKYLSANEPIGSYYEYLTIDYQ